MLTCSTLPIDQMAGTLGRPDAPLVIDVRLNDDIETLPGFIPGVRFHDFRTAARDVLAGSLEGPGLRVAVVCHRGRRLSQGVAAQLRASGVDAAAVDRDPIRLNQPDGMKARSLFELAHHLFDLIDSVRSDDALEGGMVAWAARGLPQVPLEYAAWLAKDDPSHWVLPSDLTGDVAACGWVVRRFLDRRAVMLFVPLVDVAAVSDRFGALPLFGEHSPISEAGKTGVQHLCDAFGLHDCHVPAVAEGVGALPQALDVAWRGVCARHEDVHARCGSFLPVLDALYWGAEQIGWGVGEAA